MPISLGDKEDTQERADFIQKRALADKFKKDMRADPSQLEKAGKLFSKI